MKRVWLLLTLFGVVWTLGVCAFDCFIGRHLVAGLRSQNFPHVIGYITHSRVKAQSTSHSGSDTTTYGVDIRYHYEVNGQSFEGNRFNYDGGYDSNSKWAFRAVRQFSEGAEVPVYYNPQNPADSVLSAGVDETTSMMVLFLSPFNSFMLGFWAAGIMALRQIFSRSPNGGVPFKQDGTTVRVRLPSFPPLFAGLATTGFAGFVAMMTVGISTGFHISTNVAKTVLISIWGSGLVVFLWKWWLVHSGDKDLVIDTSRGIAELPRTYGRKTKIHISLERITSLDIETITRENKNCDPSYSYAPTLYWGRGHASQGKLAEWMSEAKARAFVEWLSPQLKIGEESAGRKNRKTARENDLDKT